MNTNGCTLIGIGPNKEILGLQKNFTPLTDDPNRDGYEQRLIHVIFSYLGKESTTLVHIPSVDILGNDVCWLRVDASRKPVYLEEGNEVRFYLRTGNVTQLLKLKESMHCLTMY